MDRPLRRKACKIDSQKLFPNEEHQSEPVVLKEQ
jgi:hypothetical protein